MLLGKPEIERYIKSGHITVDPFKPENLGSAQYDVTLGEHFYRESRRSRLDQVYNPYDENHVRSKWEFCKPMTHEEYNERTGLWLVNIGLEEKLILLEPGEIILGHTEEFIGGSCKFITTMMKARSSLGRNGVEVCRCAGMGDVGYFTRWTMEIVNTSRYQTIALPVGRRVAQLLFFKVDAVEAGDVYDVSGKYQSSSKLEELKAAWKPDQMLPKQWKDRECRSVGSSICSHGINHSGERHGCNGSNMAKVGGPRNAEGKALKPEGWTPPDIEGVLANMYPPPRSNCGCDGCLDSGCYNCKPTRWACPVCKFPLALLGDSIKGHDLFCAHCAEYKLTTQEWLSVAASSKLPDRIMATFYSCAQK